MKTASQQTIKPINQLNRIINDNFNYYYHYKRLSCQLTVTTLLNNDCGGFELLNFDLLIYSSH